MLKVEVNIKYKNKTSISISTATKNIPVIPQGIEKRLTHKTTVV